MAYWIWLAAGLLCLVIEMLTPGIWFLWFGAAALLTGALSFVLPIPALVQWVMFALLSVVLVVYGRRWYGGRDSGDNALNDRTKSLLGRRVRLEEPIVDGNGVVNIDDTRWPAEGGDAPVGTLVEVTGVNRNTLQVRPVQS